jgi:MFS family permease
LSWTLPSQVPRPSSFPVTLGENLHAEANQGHGAPLLAPEHEDLPLQRCDMKARWTVLTLACTLMACNFYIYDNPSALKEYLQSKFGSSLTESKFGALYSVYSVPNVILPFIGGHFVDKYGAYKMMVIFTLCITVGQALLSLGVSSRNYDLMLVGRVFYGLGGETITVAEGAILSEWFAGSELAFALGFSLAVSRAGSSVNNYLSGYWASTVNLDWAFWFGVILCAGSVGCALLLLALDKRAGRQIERSSALRKTPYKDRGPNTCTEIEEQRLEDHEAGLSGFFRNVGCRQPFSPTFWLVALNCVVVYGVVVPFNNTSSSFLLQRDYFQALPAPLADCCCWGKQPGQCYDRWPPQEAEQPPGTLKRCQATAACAPYLGRGYAPPLNISAALRPAVDCVEGRRSDAFGLGRAAALAMPAGELDGLQEFCRVRTAALETAAVVMSVPYIISAATAPFFGYAIDMHGGAAVLTTLACVVLAAVHLIFSQWPSSQVSAVGPLVGQGIGYSLYAAALWPCVPMTVKPEQVGGWAGGWCEALLTD